MLDRFRRELKLARRVTHRNVARAHDMGEDKDQRFLTMEYIDGEPLAQQLLRRQGFSSKRILEIARAVCQGLSAAHAVGIIHCDLKPENILVGNDDRIVITDFGIARGVFDAGLRKTMGAVLGTPAYMAPEQVEGSRDLTAAADLYALGVMLFEHSRRRSRRVFLTCFGWMAVRCWRRSGAMLASWRYARWWLSGRARSALR
jgi:serine/threonine protein kinase